MEEKYYGLCKDGDLYCVVNGEELLFIGGDIVDYELIIEGTYSDRTEAIEEMVKSRDLYEFRRDEELL